MTRTLYLLLPLLFLAAGVRAQDQGIRFIEGSFEAVLKIAQQEKKPVFVDAYTTWCGPCKWMSREVFTNADVATFYNENFICFKIDMEKGEGPALAKRFGVTAYPSFLFFDKKGELVHRSIGAKQAGAFLELGREALHPDFQLVPLQKQYAAGKRDPKFMRRYITASAMAGTDVNELLNVYFAGQKDKELLREENWKLMQLFVRSSEQPVFSRFVQQKPAFEKAFTKEAVKAYLVQVYTSEVQQAASTGNVTRLKAAQAALAKLYSE